jgi:hypothetical protein
LSQTCLPGVMLLIAATANAAPIYNFVTFDGPGDNGGGTTVNAISNSGAIAGFSSNASATLLTNFIRNPDGTFTPLNVGGDPLANANGINKNNAVVGTSAGLAFTLESGLLSFLPSLGPANTAFGVNDHGAIVGQFTDNATDTEPGFVYANGQYTILNPVVNAAVTNAQSINNAGLVTGFYSTDGQHQHGFFFDTNTQQYVFPADPVQPNLFLTQFLGINDNGLAVGYWQDNAGSQHGFLYNLSTMTYSFLDDPNAATNNGVQITQITGINDSNEIAGFYVDANGVQRGFYATAGTPEPASIALLLSGLASILLLRKAAVTMDPGSSSRREQPSRTGSAA